MTQYFDCYANLENGVLTLGNDLIEIAVSIAAQMILHRAERMEQNQR